MTNTTLAIIDNSHFGGDHARNKKVDWTTCDTCPSAKKNSCTAVCAEMERYLAANGNTISHNSPNPFGKEGYNGKSFMLSAEDAVCFTVESLTEVGHEMGAGMQFSD